MSDNVISLIALISPLVMGITALYSWFQPGFKPSGVIRLSMLSASVSILAVALAAYFVLQYGMLESALIGFNDFGFSIRLDSLSILMLSMISLLGFIILKFSINYLDGDSRQGSFMGRLAASLAAVQLLVLSGNLGLLFVAWVLTSVSLHRLLIFYSERPGAHIAARKKFILARLGDAFLLAAVGFLYLQFGTGNLELIFDRIATAESNTLPVWAVEVPALLLATAAILKSAQFPTHGWLIEVMETPTPVSALLHAGLLNAGPFLIIRMAFVMEASTFAPIVLLLVGGLTALFASVVFMTQTSVKTALGYSSVGHMGFSLMVCGLGVFPAAMLHLVAHSFYKAHAFLSSGSVIDTLKAAKVKAQPQRVSPFKTLVGITLALLLYSAFAIWWGVDPARDFGLLVIGAVILLGLARIFTMAIHGSMNYRLLIRAAGLATLVCLSFFALEHAMRSLLTSQVPSLKVPDLSIVLISFSLLLIYGMAIFIQIIAPQLSNRPAYRELAIHIRNGLYANVWFDRIVGALRVHTTESRQQHASSLSESIEQNWSAGQGRLSAKS